MVTEQIDQKMSGNPIFGFLMSFGIGAVAGWIADKMSSKPALSLHMLLGIAGALIGGRVGEALDISLFGIREPIAGLLGSIFVPTGWRQIQSP
jgi:uncharacterized membrane protein YeaQ/YmgE (transglycosylase-associated protein family)